MLAITPHAWTPPHAGTQAQIDAQHTLFHPEMLYVLFVFMKSHIRLKTNKKKDAHMERDPASTQEDEPLFNTACAFLGLCVGIRGFIVETIPASECRFVGVACLCVSPTRRWL